MLFLIIWWWFVNIERCNKEEEEEQFSVFFNVVIFVNMPTELLIFVYVMYMKYIISNLYLSIIHCRCRIININMKRYYMFPFMYSKEYLILNILKKNGMYSLNCTRPTSFIFCSVVLRQWYGNPASTAQWTTFFQYRPTLERIPLHLTEKPNFLI